MEGITCYKYMEFLIGLACAYLLGGITVRFRNPRSLEETVPEKQLTSPPTATQGYFNIKTGESGEIHEINMGTELPSGGPHMLPIETLQKKTISFGKYAGQTFDEIPLAYLDWLAGQSWLKNPLKMYLEAYLQHPLINKELERTYE